VYTDSKLACKRRYKCRCYDSDHAKWSGQVEWRDRTRHRRWLWLHTQQGGRRWASLDTFSTLLLQPIIYELVKGSHYLLPILRDTLMPFTGCTNHNHNHNEVLV